MPDEQDRLPLHERVWADAQAFQSVFAGKDAERVLELFAHHCFASETTHVSGDPDASKIHEGKRQVWLWLRSWLDMTPEQAAEVAATIYDEE